MASPDPDRAAPPQAASLEEQVAANRAGSLHPHQRAVLEARLSRDSRKRRRAAVGFFVAAIAILLLAAAIGGPRSGRAWLEGGLFAAQLAIVGAIVAWYDRRAGRFLTDGRILVWKGPYLGDRTTISVGSQATVAGRATKHVLLAGLTMHATQLPAFGPLEVAREYRLYCLVHGRTRIPLSYERV